MIPISKIKVWDTSTRLFHWSIAILITYQLVTGHSEEGPSESHLIVGYCVCGLIVFRILWGFWGSVPARFSEFIKSPITVIRYILSGSDVSNHSVGHNPTGGYSVVLMVFSIIIQVSSGLFCDDDVMFSGAFSDLVSDDLTSVANQIHTVNSKILLLLVSAHLIAISWYTLFKKQNLVTPMIIGYSSEIKMNNEVRQVNEHPKRALLFAIISVGVTIILISMH